MDNDRLRRVGDVLDAVQTREPARQAAKQAAIALANGYGPTNARAREGKALLDSMW